MLKTITKNRIRYGDTDKMGVVYHPNYYIYMELGRTDYIRERGLNYSDIENMGYYMFVIETHCKYFKPALYEQIISIETILDEIKGARILFSYIIKNEQGELLAKGYTKHAFTKHNSKPVKIPQNILDVLLKEL